MSLESKRVALIALLVIILILIQLYQMCYSRNKLKNSKVEDENTQTHCSSAYELRELKNRVDKLEVDLTYIKHSSFNANNPSKIEVIEPKSKKTFKSPIVDLLKKKPLKKQRFKHFTESEVDAELRSKWGQILLAMSNEKYNEEFHKAYNRLYYKRKIKK